MATVLGTLAKLGYGYAYRVLDTQYFGVAQRRRRVFIVSHLGAPWPAPAKVLFEPESCEWNSPPSRGERKEIAGTIAAGAHPGGCNGRDAESGLIIPVAHSITTRPGERMEPTSETYIIQDAAMPRDKRQNGIGITAGGPCYTLDGHGAHAVAHTLRGEGFDASEDGTGRGTPIVVQDIADTLTSRWHCSNGAKAGNNVGMINPVISPAVAFTERTRKDGRNFEFQEDIAYALTNPGSGGRTHSRQLITPEMAVRRLTPLECERLQGFEDGWTTGESDAARYKMLGNAVCRKVSKWLGKRIVEVDKEVAILRDTFQA